MVEALVRPAVLGATATELTRVVMGPAERAVVYVLSERRDGKGTGGPWLARVSALERNVVAIREREIEGVEPAMKVIFIDAVYGAAPVIYARLHDRLMRGRGFAGLMEELGVEGVEDLRVDGRGIPYVRFRGEYVPLNVVGDGTRLLLLGVAALSCLGADLIILDDPEVHLHPGYMDVLSRCVVEAAKDGSQVLI